MRTFANTWIFQMQGPIKLVNTDKVTMLDPLSSWQMATQEATSTFQHAPSSQSRMPTKLTNNDKNHTGMNDHCVILILWDLIRRIKKGQLTLTKTDHLCTSQLHNDIIHQAHSLTSPKTAFTFN